MVLRRVVPWAVDAEQEVGEMTESLQVGEVPGLGVVEVLRCFERKVATR